MIQWCTRIFYSLRVSYYRRFHQPATKPTKTSVVSFKIPLQDSRDHRLLENLQDRASNGQEAWVPRVQEKINRDATACRYEDEWRAAKGRPCRRPRM